MNVQQEGRGPSKLVFLLCFKYRIVSVVQLSGTYCSSPFRVSSLMLVRLCNIGNSFFRISFVSISFWGSKLERKNIDVFHEFTGFKPRWSPEFFFRLRNTIGKIAITTAIIMLHLIWRDGVQSLLTKSMLFAFWAEKWYWKSLKLSMHGRHF